MCPAAPRSLLLACSLAFAPFLAVSWEIKMSDLEEKNVDEFSSNGFKCPTCFAVKGRECEVQLRWCAADKIECVEFSGIVNTGINNITVEMKRCIKEDQCKEGITSYMGFPIANQSTKCRSAIRNGATVQPPISTFFVLFLEKLLH
ncbi:uncharacterized protein LOC143664406 [Tamandua tetradactyla]|uniref:uncharacterized protein LOC143664406 n=1 Tax=Tamandua tetradactyla TaxID=48850 RepID=UPI004053BF26